MKILSHFPPGLLSRVQAEFPDAEVIQVPETGDVPNGVDGEILVTNAWGSPNLGAVMKCGVRWVHTYGTGVDAFPFSKTSIPAAETWGVILLGILLLAGSRWLLRSRTT